MKNIKGRKHDLSFNNFTWMMINDDYILYLFFEKFNIIFYLIKNILKLFSHDSKIIQ
jgi:hypothetical protein